LCSHCINDEIIMNISPPADLTQFEVLFDHSEPNPHLPKELRTFVGNVGFPAAPAERPWIFSNFVQSIDGIVTFGGRRPGGEWIARSRHDRWMMDLLRTHADTIVAGAESLILEARYGKIAGGPVYRIVDESLLEYRRSILGRGKLKVVIVTGRGRIRVEDFRLFRSKHVEALVATTPDGRRQLGKTGDVPVLVSGEGDRIDCRELARQLRRELGVEYLLCEGGPGLYGEMVQAGCIDEKFLTIAPQEIGLGPAPDPVPEDADAESGPDALDATPARLMSLSGPGFSVETAPWYHWTSCRKVGDHEFNRYRAVR
jgi:riboflavin biosynthesis pyrimidine reductase